MRNVRVVTYNPAWPDLYASTASRITPVFSNNLLSLHHIGSTAIPGIHAKPVIDILAVVANIEDVDTINPALQSLGFEPKGEFGIPGRRYFRRNDPSGNRTHHIHTFQQDSPEIHRHLAFRDYMRAHPDHAQAYGLLKQELARLHPDDINAYMDGKNAFIKDMETRALQWAKHR